MYCMVPFIWYSGKGKTIGTENGSVGLGVGEGMMIKGDRGTFWDDAF